MQHARHPIVHFSFLGGFLLLAGIFLFRFVGATDTVHATLWDITAQKTVFESRLSSLYTGAESSVIARDLGKDGVDEVIQGSGAGEKPLVTVRRWDGSRIFSFIPYDQGMRSGVSVASHDGDGDGVSEIITGTGPGAVAHVRVFNNYGKEKLLPGGFFPFGKDFRGGVRVAVGDINSDGKGELVVSPNMGGPYVRIFSMKGELVNDGFFIFEPTYVSGMNIAVGDVNGDGRAEIVATRAVGDGLVRVLSDQGEKLSEFFIDGIEGGLSLALIDKNNDGKNEIVVAPRGSADGWVRMYSSEGKLLETFLALDPGYLGGVMLATGKSHNKLHILAIPAAHTVNGTMQKEKEIIVDLSDQRLRAFEHGRLVRTFLVTTGSKKFPTPTGEFSILEKPYKVLYRWFYGPNHPENYDLGWVTWNLRFYPHIYIHYAPWREVFGVPGSHGCVNVDKVNAEWIYHWADVGTPISVRE